VKKALRPKTLIYQWFPALVLARLARFERAAFRLGAKKLFSQNSQFEARIACVFKAFFKLRVKSSKQK
jgi:hypothetical protein